jgi:O-antigen/teichoic acid export membrane protein
MLVFFRSNISGLQLFKTDSILSVLDRILMIVFCGLILWTNIFSIRMDVVIFALTQTLAYLIAGLTAFVIFQIKASLRFQLEGIFRGDLLRRSFPFALLALLMVIYTRIDVILLERLLPDGTKAAGIYAQSYRIYDAINMISVLFATLLLPMFARILAEKKDVKLLISSAFPLLITGTLIVSVVLVSFSEPLLKLLYTEFYAESPKTFVLLMISIIPVSITYIFGTLLTADGHLMKLNAVAGIALVVNVLLNIFLIPRMGVAGAAASALATQLLGAILQVWLCKKRYSLTIPFLSLMRYLVLIFLVIGIAVLIQKSDVGILYKIFLAISLSFGVSFFLKIINLKEILGAFRSGSQH